MIKASDIAKEVGVSQQVVSAVLRGNHQKASAATREKIFSCARRLNYTPNHLASMLSTGKGRFIALLFPTLFDRFFSEMLDHLGHYLMSKHYFPIYSNWSSYKEFTRIITQLSGFGLAGIITSHEKKEQFPINIPIVTYENDFPEYDRILIDDRDATENIFKQLLKLGHHHFAYIGRNNKDKRLHFLNDFLKQENMAPADFFQTSGNTSDFSMIQQITAEILSVPEKRRPTAVFCRNDVTAITFCSRMMSSGISVPQDISVIGGDNITEAGNIWPSLTTIDLNVKKIAQALSDIMIQRIEHPELPLEHRIIKAGSIWRHSCDKVRIF